MFQYLEIIRSYENKMTISKWKCKFKCKKYGQICPRISIKNAMGFSELE